MTLYVWMDEDGCWHCSHFCPDFRKYDVLLIALSEGASVAMFNRDTMEEVEIEVR